MDLDWIRSSLNIKPAKKSDVFILNFSSGKFKGISFAIGKKKFININFG